MADAVATSDDTPTVPFSHGICGDDERGWTMHASGLKFDEALAITQASGAPVAFAAMDRWATALDSRARQACRKKGFAETTRDSQGRRAWAITPAGRHALSQTDRGGERG